MTILNALLFSGLITGQAQERVIVTSMFSATRHGTAYWVLGKPSQESGGAVSNRAERGLLRRHGHYWTPFKENMEDCVELSSLNFTNSNTM